MTLQGLKVLPVLVVGSLLLGCAGKRFDPLPQKAGDGITPEIMKAWGDAQERIIDAGIADQRDVLRVHPGWFQFHRVDRTFYCRPDGPRVRGCFDPRWNLVRYVDGNYGTIVHECLHAIFWGLDIEDEGHRLIKYP